MEIEYKNIQSFFNKKKSDISKLGLFHIKSTIKISYWQPSGNVNYTRDEGFRCLEVEHQRKALQFIQCIKRDKSEIAITPEYSIPISVLEKILDDRTKIWRPDFGKLWCFGIEAISSAEMERLYSKYIENEHDDVRFIVEDLKKLNSNHFYSCIAYLFICSDKMVCILQLKTTPAADNDMILESNALTLGNTIYYFSDDHGHCLLTFICADALDQDIINIQKELHCSQYLILHPQLNPKPMHESFRQMRSNFFDFSGQEIRIIAVNWSQGTSIAIENKNQVNINESYSGYYKKGNWEIERNNVDKYSQEGIRILRDRQLLLWYMPCLEHYMQFSIDSFKDSSFHSVAAHHRTISGIIYMEYRQNEWTSCPAYLVCSVDWNWMKDEFGISGDLSTIPMSKLIEFFAILFAEKEDSMLEMKEGCRRVIFEKYTNNSAVSIARERCHFINRALDDGIIPAKFSELSNGNYQWIIDKKGNIKAKEFDHEVIPLYVIYIDSSLPEEIEKGIQNFKEMIGEEALDRLLVYHFTYKGIRAYEDIYNDKINDPRYTKVNDKVVENR